MSQKPSQIVENIKTALPAIANAIKGNWDNIQSLHIKTNSSASLPIWSCTLDDAEGGRWNGLQAQSDEEEEGLEGDEEESDAEEVKPKKAPIPKGRKRSSSSDEEEEEEEEKPKKKAKTTDISSTTKPKTPSISKSSKLASAQVDSLTKKRKVTERSLTPPKAPSAIEPSIPSGKKAQKAKSTSTATAKVTSSKSGLATKPSAVSESVEKEKKKSQTSDVASQSSAPMTVDAPLKKGKTADPPLSTKSGPSPSIADTIMPSAGRDKTSKEKKKFSKIPEATPAPAASEKGAKPSFTREELKQKRASDTGEKKKDIISKVKGGRSAKNAVLGKKVSQV